ncbi:MAG: M23 family metallopeptidase [Acidimicrobiaceae bacterium]|nr:M23 family metallopeptidase [Acidimicrobiaceae bacterium]MXY09213.1 M23 family metallopeptidase [Acidimicrobiaceae bacterium]MXZ66289.1 M23 family metallopeptidase [Acidimicrobiaceae bacterium]MYA14890.1 M23 family metallopeptidase [Acidimicrobiaceae bacterium]MYF32354.1 M23 family metallopeptidase [Acidimicrobiaceae bacterium]
MSDWRGILAFFAVVLLMVVAASWLIRETPDWLVDSPDAPVDTPEVAAPPESAGAADPVDAPVPPPEEAVDAAAIEAAIELAAQPEPAEPISLPEACAGLGGVWRDDSRGWCEMPLPSAAPVSDTAVLHPGMRVPCPQPLEKILEQVVADAVGGDEMRIYLLYRSVDEDLEEIAVSEEAGVDLQLIADGLRQVEAHMRDRAAQQRASGGIDGFLPMEHVPVPGEIGSGFGMRVHPVTGAWSQHNGVDIKGDTGDPVVAVLEGEIISAQNCPFYGNTVVVYHGAGLSTVYAHLDSFAVGPDDEVEAGQLLGAMGSTGRSTGPHLHFEARIDGTAVDPAPFLP